MSKAVVVLLLLCSTLMCADLEAWLERYQVHTGTLNLQSQAKAGARSIVNEINNQFDLMKLGFKVRPFGPL